VLVWALSSAIALAVTWSALEEGFDRRLKDSARLLLVLTRDGPSSDTHEGRTRARFPGLDDEHLVYQLRDSGGRLLMSSPHAPEAPLANLRPGFSNSPNWRTYTTTDPARGLWIHAADRQSHRLEGILQSLLSLALPLLVAAPLTAWLLGWWLRRALEPLATMAEDLARRGRGDLSALNTEGLPAELARVADSMNDLMARLERALSQERAFSAQAAHELRTPLAAAIAQVQLLATQSDEVTRPRLLRVERRLSQLSRTVELLLQWSRAQAGIGFDVRPVALDGVIEAVLADLDPNQRHDLHWDPGPPVGPVLGDSTDHLSDLIDVITLPGWPDPLLLAEIVQRAEAVVGHSYHLTITAMVAGVPVHTPGEFTDGKYTALAELAVPVPVVSHCHFAKRKKSRT
jgi:two-component system OmpR family sensor kinase